MPRLRVLIADDRQQVRRELGAILPLAGRIEVIGEAADGLEAVRLAETLQPEAVVLDLQMPGLDGFQAAAQIKRAHPGCRLVALTVHDDEASRLRAAQSGIDAFVVKGAPISTLVEALTSDKEFNHGTQHSD